MKQLPFAALRNYLFVALLLVAGWFLSRITGSLVQTGLAEGGNASLLPFLQAIIILIVGFLAYEAAKPTVIPSFVLVILIGMLERSSLAPLTEQPLLLSTLTTVGAAFILFGGGLDTPFRRFRILVAPILSIAFFGTIITALLVAFTVQAMSGFLHLSIPVGAMVLLGAAIASTDPAAIIPSLKSLVFPNPRVKDIAISESAINDVMGAVLTGVFLMIIGSGVTDSTISSLYARLFTPETGMEVLYETLVGIAVGFIGFLILHGWSRWKASSTESGEADAALFMAVPLFAYFTAVYFHGSGFLAVFIAGLLFQLEDHVSHVEHYFVHTIEGFMKPLIFILLGATVDVSALLSSALPGILTGVVFILVIRPIAVFLTLFPFMRGAHRLSLRELLFLSFVRETGVIPAVLLMTIGAAGIAGAESIVPIGLWVILLTLLIQPPLTPFFARLLRIADNAPAFPNRKTTGTVAVLCSRGRSYIDRLPSVIRWADQHGVKKVVLLHCAEGRYETKERTAMEVEAKACFLAINADRTAKNAKSLSFELLSLPGLLQNNIRDLIRSDNVSIVFVGEKMLDYRLQDVKHLGAPFVFLR